MGLPAMLVNNDVSPHKKIQNSNLSDVATAFETFMFEFSVGGTMKEESIDHGGPWHLLKGKEALT